MAAGETRNCRKMSVFKKGPLVLVPEGVNRTMRTVAQTEQTMKILQRGADDGEAVIGKDTCAKCSTVFELQLRDCEASDPCTGDPRFPEDKPRVTFTCEVCGHTNLTTLVTVARVRDYHEVVAAKHAARTGNTKCAYD